MAAPYQTLHTIILRGTFVRIPQLREKVHTLGDLSSLFIVYNITIYALNPPNGF